MKMVWVLIHAKRSRCKALRSGTWTIRENVWKKRGRWPRPMGFIDSGQARFFASRFDAEEFLFQKHVRKGRDVSFAKPARIHLKTLRRYGYKVKNETV